MDYFEEIIDGIINGRIRNKEELNQAKREVAIKYGLQAYPTDADILNKAGENKKKVVKVLQTKPSRTRSGVAVVAVMTNPEPCPHGKCAYCPGGVDNNSPQSYTGKEPAAMRGIQYSYHAFDQVTSRLHQLEMIGHPCDKIEMIIMGGTFTARPYKDQVEFVKSCFDGLNGQESATIERAQMVNEDTKHRCVGLTVETRPDYCTTKYINYILGYGATRVELGVQHPDDEIYETVSRGHTVKDVVDATQKLKDSGLKVCYHLMPGLPGSSCKKDLEMFENVFTNTDYKPDMIKIYPTLLIDPEYGKTKLYDMYKKGDWKPYPDEKLVELIAKAKATLPEWVRVMRVQRDIPSPLIFKGIKSSNLRQLVHRKMKELNLNCKCIRCNEIKEDKPKDPKISIQKYEASGGSENFISFKDKDKLVGFLRLRIPNVPFRPELTKDTALVRELHVYGHVVPIGEDSDCDSQHNGFGAQLLEQAEKIAKEEYSCKKIAVMSGVGVRNYYRKFKYELEGPYMTKNLI